MSGDESGGEGALDALRARIAELERRLAREEERFRFVLGATSEGFHLVSPEGLIVDCNEAFASCLGYRREEIIGMDISAIDCRPPEVIRALTEALRSSGFLRFTALHHHKDGHPIDVEVSTHVVFIDGEEMFCAFSHLITEQIARERALRESEQRFRGIFDSTAMFVALLDPAGEVLECNRTMLDFVGEPGEALRGRPLWEAPCWSGDPSAREALAASARSASEGVAGRCGAVIRGHRGQDAALALTLKPIVDERGRAVLLLAEGYDVTDLRRAEAARAALQEELIAGQQAMIRELSAPLIPVDEGVLVMPLVGKLDAARGAELLERLLTGIAAHRASTVILDVTGVPSVNAEVAAALVRAAQAARLLGAEVMLTGIRPDVARALTALGVDLEGIVALGSLRAGIARAARARPGREEAGSPGARGSSRGVSSGSSRA